MNYIIKFIGGGKTIITQDEFNRILTKTGLVAIPSTGEVVNMSSISRIVPETMAEELEDRKDHKVGTLHDGLKVIRHFGVWYLDDEYDEKGNPTKRIDPTYYPEVARDCVPSREKFKELKALPREDRLEIILQGSEERTGGMTKICPKITKELPPKSE